MKKIILLSVLFIISISISSQIIMGGSSNSNTSGNTSTTTVVRKSKKEVKMNTLDNATIRCYYKYTHPLTIEKEKMVATDTMTLDIGPKVSLYYDATRIKRDSIFSGMMNSTLDPSNIKSISVLKDQDPSILDGKSGTNFQSNHRGETTKLYKKRQDKEIIMTDRNEGLQRYKCTEKNVSQQWNITSDTLTVLGYLCQKATTSFRGRNYEVWFAPEIPVNDGPWKLYGLPGLILKVTDSDHLFSFEIVGLEQLQTPAKIDMAEEDYIHCNRKELDKLKARRSGGMAVNINGGEIVMVSKKNLNEYLSLETE